MSVICTSNMPPYLSAPRLLYSALSEINAESNGEIYRLQACTGIEDIGEAFLYLEETNWDLLVSMSVDESSGCSN